jgi:hypothetical protein
MDVEQAVVVEAPDLVRSGPSVGLSAGLTSGFGPTLGVPFGRHVGLQVTLLPVVVDDGFGGSYGLRVQNFLGHNPRARMYLVAGGSASGWDQTWMWGVGAGAGVEVCRDPETGLRGWADVAVTAFGVDEPVAVLPLPELGLAWVF